MKTERPMPRLTELGYPILSNNLSERIFGKQGSPAMSRLSKQRAENLLKEFDIQTPVDYPEHLYDGPLPLPDLQGDTLTEHFEQVAKEQVGQYKKWGDAFAKCKLPELPPISEFVFKPGWHRYELVKNKWKITKVPYPQEDAFTFDTETYVHGGAFPIIGTALSEKAAYVWLAAELIDPTIPEDNWDQHALIPVGRQRFIAGHNISYDRVRAREGYSLENTEPENFYFDTLSAHIGVSGLAGGQRWLYVLAGKDPEDLTDEEKRKLRYAPKWLDQGSTNSLVQCYNFHVAAVRKYFGENVTELGSSDKEVRDIFVKATHLSQIRQMLTEALDYALKDAFYTAELFQALWPKYLDSTPSMVALCGHYHLNGSVVPLVPDWEEWIQNVERVFQEHNEEMTQLCRDLVWQNYEAWKESDDKDEFEVRDPWLSQLDWEVKSLKGKYAGVPNWIRPFIKDPDTSIGVKSRLAHLLLKLEWEGKPITFIEGEGWCYWSDEED
jgi:DNA polymerase gamma 1